MAKEGSWNEIRIGPLFRFLVSSVGGGGYKICRVMGEKGMKDRLVSSATYVPLTADMEEKKEKM